MKVTIKDIATRLNLDISSVSYALSGKGSMKAETRELVRKTAEDMGYIPNGLAKKVSTGKSNIAGIVMPNILFGYGEFVQHTSRILLDAGLETNISITEFSEERERAAVRYLLESRSSGFIIKSKYTDWRTIPPNHPFRVVAKNNLPVISYGYSIQGSPFSCVNINMIQSGRTLGELLKQKGARTIKLLVPHPPPFFRNVTELMKGLEETGFDPANLSLAWVDTDSMLEDMPVKASQYEFQLNELLTQAGIRAGEFMMKNIIKSRDLPDAVICMSENNVMGVWNEAAKNNLDIPGSMALACVERSLLLAYSPVPVTSCSVPIKTCAEATTGLFLEMLEQHQHQPQTVDLEPLLYIGETT